MHTEDWAHFSENRARLEAAFAAAEALFGNGDLGSLDAATLTKAPVAPLYSRTDRKFWSITSRFACSGWTSDVADNSSLLQAANGAAAALLSRARRSRRA